MQNFYGRALRDNKSNVLGMARSTRAFLKHYSSTLEDPCHDDCPRVPLPGAATSVMWLMAPICTSQ